MIHNKIPNGEDRSNHYAHRGFEEIMHMYKWTWKNDICNIKDLCGWVKELPTLSDNESFVYFISRKDYLYTFGFIREQIPDRTDVFEVYEDSLHLENTVEFFIISVNTHLNRNEILEKNNI
jgi:hypothetical protein